MGAAAPVSDPYAPSASDRQAYRKKERGTGLRGPALHHAMQAWNTQQDAANKSAAEATATQQEQQLGLDTTSPLAPKDPAKYIRNLQKGLGAGLPHSRQVDLFRHLAKPYQPQQTALGNELGTALNEGAPVPGLATGGTPDQNLAQENHLLGQLEDYTTANLGVGLTDAQKAAYRATMRAPFEQKYSADVAATGAAEAGAGIDPRSGFGGAMSRELELGREQGLSNIEQNITEEDIAQRNVNEQFAQQTGQAVQQGIESDTNAKLRRLAEVEGGMAGLANLGETERQFDFGTLTSANQARLERMLQRQAGLLGQPSTLEEVAGGISGVLQGVGA